MEAIDDPNRWPDGLRKENDVTEKLQLLCAQLRLKLHAIDRMVEQIETKPTALTPAVEESLEARLARVDEVIRRDRASVAEASAKVRAWVDHARDQANAQRDEWRAQRRTHDLNARADDAEVYAFAVLELADAATRECSHAILEALLARSDANQASLAEAGPLPT
ncbi:hypothetical protein [Prosthecomicrobium sp. N25]|uniref:hypothetical protein n=1 Tax=Prosthecomicrobium sp. N25 TaxID=3129254 RepID=UPI00307827F5